jgi:hypothetical protein
MSDTPETDACWNSASYDPPIRAMKMLRHAQKMQRERDKAREENAKLHKIAERAIDDLAWFHYSNAQRLRAELNQLKEGAK